VAWTACGGENTGQGGPVAVSSAATALRLRTARPPRSPGVPVASSWPPSVTRITASPHRGRGQPQQCDIDVVL